MKAANGGMGDWGVIPMVVLIPTGAKWLAQDPNGMWWAFKRKPRVLDTGSRRFWISLGPATCVCSGEPPADFSKELYKLEFRDEK